MTLGLTDGKTLYALRYASDGEAPTLYYTRDTEDAYKANPELRGKFSKETRLIASEPAGKVRENWLTVPQSSFLRVQGMEVEITPFKPRADT